MSNGYKVVPFPVLLSRLPKALRDPIDVFNRNLSEFGDPYAASMGDGRVGVITTKPAIIQHVLQKNHRAYEKSDLQTKKLARFLGHGLLTLEGKEWLRQRRLIQPGFHKEKIMGLSDLMQSTIDTYFEGLSARTRAGGVIGMHEEMMKLAFHIVGSSLLGTNVTQKDIDQLRQGVDLSQQVLVKLIRVPFLEWYFKLKGSYGKAIRATRASQDLIMSYVRKRRDDAHHHDDLLDMLLHARYEDTKETMTDQQLLFELMVMFVAGHETSANALTWTLYLLASHPEVRERLLTEMHNSDSTYMRQVINESLRLYPPAWITDRVALQDDEVAGIKIPKGAIVISYIYGTHHHPELWPDPEKFDPGRFHPDENIAPFNFLPFGGGPRLCIGMQFALMEIEMVLRSFLERFHFELVDRVPVKKKPLITLNPQGPVSMKVTPRR